MTCPYPYLVGLRWSQGANSDRSVWSEGPKVYLRQQLAVVYHTTYLGRLRDIGRVFLAFVDLRRIS